MAGNTDNCKIDHSNRKEILINLAPGQGGYGRHKCAGCAYEKGLEDGRSRKSIINLDRIMLNLPISQAGYQRHKDPVEAYIKGYYDGLKETAVKDEE